MADQPVVLFQFFGAVIALWALLQVFFVGCKRRLNLQMQSMLAAQPRQRAARWQAGRWDTDERHAYVANIGDGAAHDVRVTEGQRVVATAAVVPPYSTDELLSTSGLPCYLNFCIHADVKQRIPVNAGSARRGVHAASAGGGQCRVAITVSWRTEDGEWSKQEIQAD